MIATQDFRLDIDVVAKRTAPPGGPYLDWIEVRIAIEEPGMAAAGTWQVMPSELMQFRDQLDAMRVEVRPTMMAELRGIEPNFGLTLRMRDRGAILGEWRFQPVPPEGASIAGRCGIDQSFLNGMIAKVDELLSRPLGDDSNG